MDARQRRATGSALRRKAQGRKADALQDLLVGLDAGVAEWADDFVFGTVWQRPGLSFEERSLIAIAALATGGHSAQLHNYLHGALQEGIPAEKIQECLVMLVVYAGFPAATTALAVWAKVKSQAGLSEPKET